MPLQRKPHATSHLLITLMALNVAGVFLLFIKSELDVQQIRNEIGVVRKAGEMANLTEDICSQDFHQETASVTIPSP